MRMVLSVVLLGGCLGCAPSVVPGDEDAGITSASTSHGSGTAGGGPQVAEVATSDQAVSPPAMPGPEGAPDAGVDVTLEEMFAGAAAPVPMSAPDARVEPEPDAGAPQSDASEPPLAEPDATVLPPDPVACVDVAPLRQELTQGYVYDCDGTAPCDDGRHHSWCDWAPGMDPVACTYYAVMWERAMPTCMIPRGWCARAQDDADCYAQPDHAPFASSHAVRGFGWVELEIARMQPTQTGALVCPLRCL